MPSLKQTAFVIILLALACCSQAPKPRTDIKKDWLNGAPAKTEVISTADAVTFINSFFDLLDASIFDPTYRRADRDKVREDVLADFSDADDMPFDYLPRPHGITTREQVLKSINSHFRAIKLSHVMVLTPDLTEKVLDLTGSDGGHPLKDGASSEMIGDVGVIRIKTFLVPSITLKQLEQAKKKVKKAKYLVYDLRGNGGGSVSSDSYAVESIIGPSQTIQFSRSRQGLGIKTPVIKEGFFDDSKNGGSEADIGFESQNNFVEWKTRAAAKKDPRKTVIIVNQDCASSCDIFSIAVKEHQAATLVGTTTAGAVLGAIASKVDWQGYTAIIPVSQVISPNGKLYEGLGVTPDVEIKSCQDTHSAECLKQAVALVKSKATAQTH